MPICKEYGMSSNLFDNPIKRERRQRRLAVANLKRCPLCGALNSRLNGECFTCGWYGRFNTEASQIEEGLDILLERCPDLKGASLGPRPHPNWVARLIARFHRRKIDLWV
jgi:hypothetical protein